MGTVKSISLDVISGRINADNLGVGQQKPEEVFAAFQSVMDQCRAYMNASATTNSSQANVTAAESSQGQSQTDYAVLSSGKKSEVAQAAEAQVTPEQMEEAKAEVDDFAEEVISDISQKLDVSEEDVANAMEVLGLTVLDLLNPQNLGSLVMELTGMEDSTQLLLDTDFQSLVVDVAQYGENLMEQLDLKQPEELSRLISMMEVTETAEVADMAEVTAAPELAEELTVPEAVSVKDEEEVVPNLMTGETVENRRDFEEVREVSEPKEDLVRTVETAQVDQTASAPEEETQSGNDKGDFTGQRESAETGLHQEPAWNAAQNTVQADIPVQEVQMESVKEVSYTSVDTVKIIDQIVESARTMVFQDGTSSIEMQLNPEHLGRIYLNVTARDGLVNARFMATNDAVRAALEAQIADLRENLNQAGVKVDAIEVTVSSHGFEENLEQDAHREEEAAEQAEQNSVRRSLRLDSLDELSGIMTEEEALAAQIMKDNGNTMDVIA